MGKKKKRQKTKEVSSVAVTAEEATASFLARAGDDKEGESTLPIAPRKRGRPGKIAGEDKEGWEEGEGEKGGVEGNKKKKEGVIEEEEKKDEQQVKEEDSWRITTRSRAARRKNVTPRKSS